MCKEAATNNAKIESGLILGLDEIVVATQPAFDELITELKELTYYKPEKIDVLVSSRVISG